MEASEIQKLAKEANGATWKYLTQDKLGADERVQMLSSAYASLYLWVRGGGTVLNLARGHWLISRVLCVLEEDVLAEHHARLCRIYTEESFDKKDFDSVYAVEAEARVAALKQDRERAVELRTKASEMAAQVSDPEDREIVVGDVKSEPWFGI